MKVLHLPGSLSRRGGGVFNVALHHCKQLHKDKNIQVSVIGTQDEASFEDEKLWEDIPTERLRISIPKLHQIKGLKKKILNQNPDLLHSHMLWTSQSRVLNSIRSVPYVVSPHGMLDGWVMSSSKRLALRLFERKSLSNAACIHALNLHEYKTLRGLGFKNPIAIIPNGIVNSKPVPKTKARKHEALKKMLFLSRLDPKKGLINLIEAWSKIKIENWHLEIYGWGEEAYIKSIESKISELGLQSVIKLKGEVHGKEKDAVYQSADAFVLPSFSEGFPMVVLEAWQHELPVLLTSSCNMPEAFEHKAGFKIRNEASKMAVDIKAFFDLPESEKLSLGKNGLELTHKQFDWHIIGNSLKELYNWILNGGTKPHFVMLK